MAYTQKPGGPMKQKTGHGIPSVFLQERKPNYQAANIEEATDQFGSGATYHATRILQDYPEQQKHLIKNVEKNPTTGKITSYETKRDARKAVEQIQVARDSMNYLKGIKDPAEREYEGRRFSFNFSPNSAYGKKTIERQGGEYQGPGKESASQKDKEKILNNLRAGAISSRSVTNQEDPQSVFGIAAVPKALEQFNRVTGVKTTTPKGKKPAPTQMRSKASAAKMKKC